MMARAALFVLSTIVLLGSAQADTEPFAPAVLGKSIDREFGSVRQDYFFPGRVSSQINIGMGIPHPAKRIADGNYLISGCRPHSCDEKSAVIASPTGKMLAAGIIFLSCSPKPGDRGENCEFGPHLRIFLTKNSQPAFVRELQNWAEREGYKGISETKILP